MSSILSKKEMKNISKSLDGLVNFKEIFPNSPTFGKLVEIVDGPLFYLLLYLADKIAEEKLSEDKIEIIKTVLKYCETDDVDGLIEYLTDVIDDKFDLSDAYELIVANTLALFKSYIELAIDKMQELREDADEQDEITTDGDEEE